MTLQGTLISSVHGRDRRAQRQIGKKDLLAAVQFGKKTLAHPDPRTGEKRWKYTFANIVYITDATSRNEITSYVLPLEIQKISLGKEEVKNHNLLKNRLLQEPWLCTSHTVLVIDHSGSMRTSDVDNYRSRIDAVYGTIALDYVGAQMDNGQIRGTDVLSLIEMRDSGNILLYREPITNVLYNKILDLRETNRAYSHGNYIPSLALAEKVLSKDKENINCALLLLFLSDGKPSDQGHLDVNWAVLTKVHSLYQTFKSRLTIGTIGFAQNTDFTVLESMANAPKTFNLSGCVGIFQKSDLCARTLGNAISSLSTRLSATRTTLTLTAARGPVRDYTKEKYNMDLRLLSKGDWGIYTEGLSRVRWSTRDNDWKYYESLFSDRASAVVMRKQPFGEGAERIVYQFDEAYKEGGRYSFEGLKLVAKESRFVQDEHKKISFHKTFCKTQIKAQAVAHAFNKDLKLRAQFSSVRLPTIHFLDCEIYEFSEGNYERGVLVEKMLDPSKYKKWNGNDGYVRGQERDYSINLNELFEQLQISTPKERDMLVRRSSAKEVHPNLAEYFKLDDMPQAFSHYSYYHSKRQLLVCDLQGVYDDSDPKNSKFEFTDPVIHYSTDSNRKHTFGRTDRGKHGIFDFFKSHDCNTICRLLGLPNDIATISEK